jgi:radical SAM superfamily enzyme YgiQ (UPF0313 family)
VNGLKKVIRNEITPLVEDLDLFPFPDRDFYNYNNLLMNHSYEGYELEAAVKKGRGCAFSCAYCSNASLREIYRGKGPYVRSRSVPNVMAELQYLKKRFPLIRSFHFEDDTFTLDKAWVHEFCDVYEREIQMPFRVYVNPLTVNKDLLKRLKDAGLYEVSIGVECGNEKFRKEVLGRSVSNRRLLQVFQWLHDLKIRSFALMIIGFPDETKALILESMDFIMELKPFHTQIVTYYPYPGNPLYRYCEENKLLTRRTKTTIFRGESTIRLKGMNRTDFLTLYDDFWRLSFELREQWFKRMGLKDVI